jgi:hypothetical protein
MVCDTVMMGCAFGLVSDGSLPEAATLHVVWIYMSGLSVSISLLTVSLWCSFIVCRRLNQVTAWALMEMQQEGQEALHLWQLEEEMNAQKLQKKFDQWFKQHCLTMSANAENALTGTASVPSDAPPLLSPAVIISADIQVRSPCHYAQVVLSPCLSPQQLCCMHA